MNDREIHWTNELQREVERLRAALHYLLLDVDTIQRTEVIRESDVYKAARRALEGSE